MKMKRKILLVEDNPDHANLTMEIMAENNSEGIEKEIVLVKDGQEAIDYLRKEDTNDVAGSQIELVLLDLDLPNVCGMDVLKFLKKSLKYNSVPVVILSGVCDRRVIAEAYDNGADSFIVKPVSYEVFARNLMAIEHYWLIKYVGCDDV